MRIERGSTRVVLIVFGWVFKFPALRQRTIKGRMFHYLRGMIANLTEFATYINCGRPYFLVPVVSFGFVSIQRFQPSVGRLTLDEIGSVISQFSEKSTKALFHMGGHWLDPANLRLTSRGIRLIDYGDLYEDVYPVSAFLRRYHEEVAEVFAKANTATTN